MVLLPCWDCNWINIRKEAPFQLMVKAQANSRVSKSQQRRLSLLLSLSASFVEYRWPWDQGYKDLDFGNVQCHGQVFRDWLEVVQRKKESKATGQLPSSMRFGAR
jgi:hypothetical protein